MAPWGTSPVIYKGVREIMAKLYSVNIPGSIFSAVDNVDVTTEL